MKERVPSIILIILASWLSMTIAVDFVAVPSVFRTIPNAFLAGRVGIKVFSLFNPLEFVLSIPLVFLLWKSSIQRALAIILCANAAFYLFYLSPQIGEIAPLMEKASGVEFMKYSKDHNFHHQLYVRLDSLKILLLASLLGIRLYKGARI